MNELRFALGNKWTRTGRTPIDPSNSSSSTWPNAANTGVPAGTTLIRVPLDAVNGQGWEWGGNQVRPTSSNVTISNLDVSGDFNAIGQTGITLQNCRFRYTGDTDGSFAAQLGPGAIVRDCEFGGGADGVTIVGTTGIYARGTAQAPILIERCNIHHSVHGIHTDGYTTVRDSYMWHMVMGEAPYEDAHSECVFISTGHFITFEHCRFKSGNSATWFAQNYDNTSEGTGDIVVNNCKFESDLRNGEIPSWGLVVDNKAIRDSNGNAGSLGAGSLHVTNNVFDTPNAGVWEVSALQLPIGGYAAGNTYTDGRPADGDTLYVPVIY